MSFSVILNQEPKTTYPPGSLVFGRVQLIATEQQSMGTIFVRFAGRCTVAITKNDNKYENGTTYYYSEGYYFNRQTFLHNGNFTCDAGTYTWPFEFVMPTYADPGVIVSTNIKGDTFRPAVPFCGSNAEEPKSRSDKD